MREVVNDFYSSKYASCLNRLQRLRPMLELDIYVHSHLPVLYRYALYQIASKQSDE